MKRMNHVRGKRVQVYWNLHRQCYSIRQSGRVIGHTDQILLDDVRFNVAPAGRDKVRRTGVKNVHATVTGYMVTDMQGTGITGMFGPDYDSVSYNPYKYDSFVKITSNGYDGFYADPIRRADHAILTEHTAGVPAMAAWNPS